MVKEKNCLTTPWADSHPQILNPEKYPESHRQIDTAYLSPVSLHSQFYHNRNHCLSPIARCWFTTQRILWSFQELEVINNAQAILKRAIRECETQIKCVLRERHHLLSETTPLYSSNGRYMAQLSSGWVSDSSLRVGPDLGSWSQATTHRVVGPWVQRLLWALVSAEVVLTRETKTRVLKQHGSLAAALQSCYIHTHTYFFLASS